MTTHASAASLDSAVQQHSRQPRRRRSSHLTRWIQEQHRESASTAGESDATARNSGVEPSQPSPRLAYPELGPRGDDCENIDSYDIIDETETLDSIPDPKHEASTLPVLSRTSRYLQTSTTLRRIHLPFRPSSPSPSKSPTATLRPSSPARPSLSATFLPKALRATPSESSFSDNGRSHARSASLSMLFIGTSSEPQHENSGSISPPPVKKRPSILHIFSSSSPPTSFSPSSTLVETLPRPSLSSVNTLTTSCASTSDVGGLKPPTSVTSSIFSTPRAPSSHTVWSRSGAGSSARCSSPALLSDLCDLPNSRMHPTGKHSNDYTGPSTTDKPSKPTEPARPYVAYTPSSSATLSSFASSTRGRNYKKLVVSGIGVDEHARFEGVRRWCESFGEIRCITRVPNGDLHVHFKDSTVADTVCRIRAKVFIAGAGSVFLSWYSGSKR